MEYGIRRFYGERIRPLLPSAGRRWAKYAYSMWGYRQLFTIRSLSCSERWHLFQRFVEVDFHVPHGHWPCEMAEIAKFLLDSPRRPEAVMIEAGCWQGGSTAKFSILCEMCGYVLHVYDSFQGVEATDQEGYDYTGEYSAEEALVRNHVRRYGVIDVCRFHPGWFQDTIAKVPVAEPVMAAYIDCDLAKGTVEVLRGTLQGLCDEGLVFTQDFHIPPVRKALEAVDTWTALRVRMPRIERHCHNLASLHFERSGSDA